MTSPRPRRSKQASLLAQIREANERLTVAVVQAQNLSEEAQAEAAQLRAELDELTNRLRDANEQSAARPDAAARAEMERRLTARQRQILTLIAEGKSNKEIGVLLGITTRTAETHRTQIMAKLDLHSMNELVRYAIRRRIIEP